MLHNIFVDVDQKHIIVVDLLITNSAKAIENACLKSKIDQIKPKTVAAKFFELI